MRREDALRELPVALAAALRLREDGQDHDVIARALGIEPEGVPNLLEIAEAKLQRLLADEPT